MAPSEQYLLLTSKRLAAVVRDGTKGWFNERLRETFVR